MSVYVQKNKVINPYFAVFTESKHSGKVLGSNFIVYTEFRDMYVKQAFLNTSIKYVVTGRENYRVDNTDFRVNAKHFFISSPCSEGSGYVQSRTSVKGISIDIDNMLLQQAFTLLKDTTTLDFDNASARYFSEVDFFECVTSVGSSSLSQTLLRLEERILSDDYELSYITDEWFYHVAESLVYEQYPHFRCLKRLAQMRLSTRKEILRRLLYAKEYIELNLLRKMTVHEIAEACFMAEFHFFRCFREAFGITPLHYITMRRMEKSRSLLSNQKTTIREVAEISGYADIHSFSKTFKKYFGYAPSALKSNHAKNVIEKN